MKNMLQLQFKNFITLQRGFDLPRKDRVLGDYPVVASTAINGYHAEHKVQPPGVVTGRSGSLGEVLYIDKPFWPLNTTLWVKDFIGNLPLYVYYFLKTLDLKQYNSGAGVPTLNRNHLDTLEVAIHDFQSQHKIAVTLSAYDDMIENNLRRIKILEEMAQAIYREWFVKFRFPGHETVGMVDSTMENIPKGWGVRDLGDVIELAYGKGLKKTDRAEGNVPVYGSSGVVGYHDMELVKGPGIIVGRKGNVGSVHWSDSDFFPIDTVFYVKTKLSLYYVFYNLQTQNFINTDAAVPGLSRNQAYLLPFLVPSYSILKQFEEMIEPFFALLMNMKDKVEVLRRTRDLLLPKLISGELDVSDLDIKTGAQCNEPDI